MPQQLRCWSPLSPPGTNGRRLPFSKRLSRPTKLTRSPLLSRILPILTRTRSIPTCSTRMEHRNFPPWILRHLCYLPWTLNRPRLRLCWRRDGNAYTRSRSLQYHFLRSCLKRMNQLPFQRLRFGGALTFPELYEISSLRTVAIPIHPQPHRSLPIRRSQKKSKSALDLKLLRRRDKKEQNSPTKDNKENQRPQQLTTPLPPPSSRRPYSVEVTVPPLGKEPEGLFAPPVAYSSRSRAKVTTSGSDSSVPSLAQSSSSTSSKGSARKQEIEELVRKYTPTEYTAGSRQGYFGSREPVLIKPSETDSSHRSKEKKPRPKGPLPPPPAVHGGGFSVASPRKSHEVRRSEDKRPPDPPVKDEKNSPASSQSSGRSGKAAGLDLAGIDTAFEALLVCSLYITRERIITDRIVRILGEFRQA